MKEIGEADLGCRSREADSADEQAHGIFLAGEYCSTAARTTDLRVLARAVRNGIGLPFGFLRRI